MPESGHQVRFCLDVPGDVHWMKQSKLNLPNAFPKFGEPFFVSVHPIPELVLFTVIFALFPLRKTATQSITDITATSTSLDAISDLAALAMLNKCLVCLAKHVVWTWSWTPWWGSTKVEIKYQMLVRVIRQESVSALTFNWLFKWWPVIKLYSRFILLHVM